jgi:hypothetical protein
MLLGTVSSSTPLLAFEMPAKGALKIGTAVRSRQDFLSLAIAVEKQQGDVLDAMLVGETQTFILADIGDEILKLALFEVFERRPRFFLKSLADRTLRIVDLDDRRDSVADLAKIGFLNSGPHLGDDVPTDSSRSGEDQRAIPEPPEKVPSIDRHGRRFGFGFSLTF